MISRRPTARPASSNFAIWKVSGPMRAPIETALGASSLRRPICFGMSGKRKLLTPVRLPPGPAETGDEARLDWVNTGNEDDRNGGGRRLHRSCGGLAPGSDDDSNLATHKVVSQFQ